MKNKKNIFLRKKILIYGLGKSGISSYKFLKKKADVYLFDDNSKINKKLVSLSKISKISFDVIIISPGIDISKCKLSTFLKKNSQKIYTDLDVLYSFYDNLSITITGTNGKSTTAKILHGESKRIEIHLRRLLSEEDLDHPIYKIHPYIFILS